MAPPKGNKVHLATSQEAYISKCYVLCVYPLQRKQNKTLHLKCDVAGGRFADAPTERGQFPVVVLS